MAKEICFVSAFSFKRGLIKEFRVKKGGYPSFSATFSIFFLIRLEKGGEIKANRFAYMYSILKKQTKMKRRC